MKILQVCHNIQSSGGKDWVAEADKRLLKKNGHRIIHLGHENRRAVNVSGYPASYPAQLHREQSSSIVQLIQKHRPNLVHIYNTISTGYSQLSITCQKLGLPIIHSLYRYEALCPKSSFFYSNKLCISCMKQFMLKHDEQQRCCRDNQNQITDIRKMIRDYWDQKACHGSVDYYLVPTEFFREKLIEYGFPNHKVVVKPHFSSDETILPTGRQGEDYALFIGKLTEESGIRTLLSAWSSLPGIPLKILGDGPLRQEVEAACSRYRNIKFLGWQSKIDCTYHLARALLLVFPKESHEVFPSTIIRAYAYGVAVIASDLEGMEQFVIDGVSGCLFPPADARALAEKALWLWENRDILTSIREGARVEYEEKYSEEKNYQLLMSIYQDALSQKKRAAAKHSRNIYHLQSL